MLYVLTATDKSAGHATALGMYDTPGMANLAAAMLRKNTDVLGDAGEISVHMLPPRPASCLDALLHQIHPEGLPEPGSEVGGALVRHAA
jgi:hypothetical protein